MYGPVSILLLLLNTTPWTVTEAPTTHFGVHFLVLPPAMSSIESNVDLYLTTYHVAVYVLYNQDKGNGSNKSNTLLIERDSVTTFELNQALSTAVNSGRSRCHDFKSDREFSVTVLLRDTPTSMAIIKLVPVSGWGVSYYAVTLASKAIVVVMTVVENRVTMVINSRLPSRFAVYIDDGHWGGYYTKESSINFNLDKSDGYIVSMCHVDHVTGYLTGSAITSAHPVGVISGSCYSGTVTKVCETNKVSRHEPSQDIVAEMLLPQETYGTSFIIPDLIHRVSRGSVITVGTGNLTLVSMQGMDAIYLMKSGDWAMLNMTQGQGRGPRHLNSSSPIQVIYLQNSRCWSSRHKDRGDAAITLVLPIALYYHTYYWGSPIWPGGPMEQFVLIVIKRGDSSHLRIDGAKVAHRNIELVSQLNGISPSDWWQMDLRVHGYFHYIYTHAGINFNCVLLGIAEQTSSMYNAGFRTNKINQHCVPTYTTIVKGDGLDNDCDGLIDEEMKDLQDNDSDGKVDEDLAPPIRGEWGEWHRWICLQNCKGSIATRHRYCNDPMPEAKGLHCQGNSKESRRNYCNTGLACPEDCPEKTFGLGCQMSCENCRTDCSKLYGTCLECEPGFRMPQNFCITECPTGTYGLQCAGNCKLKCGEDCYERIKGNCFVRLEAELNNQFSVRDFTQFFPLIVSIMPLAVLFAVYRRAERERRDRLKSSAYLDYRRRTRRSTVFKGERKQSRRSTRTRLSVTQGTSHGRERKSLRESVTFKDTPIRESVTLKDTAKRESVVFKDTPIKESVTLKDTAKRESVTFIDTPIRESVTLKDTDNRESVTFKDTPIRKSVTSKGTAKRESVTLKDITKRESVTFKNTPIRESVTFKDTTIGELVNFKDIAIRESVTLKDTANRESVTFKDTPIRESVTSKGTAKRESVTLKDIAKRESVTFKNTPIKESVTFKDTTIGELVTFKDIAIRESVTSKDTPIGESVTFKDTASKESVTFNDTPVRDLGTFKDNHIFSPVKVGSQSIFLKKDTLKTDRGLMDDVLMDGGSMARSSIARGSVISDSITANIQSTDLQSDSSRKNDVSKMNKTEIKEEDVLWDQVKKSESTVATTELYGSDVM